ncbi:Uncharacterized iron-regulated membrane protein [Novosphingobium sp. CF614]|uniref:PepSY-associated TM helix domain-containing protein n=1 Tax=Novosphingobium sp. CF614 TaxID=1884364 RepID=UPI0008ECF3F8|nr:PepSY-associated TM helix domain-containing protein [Novosphingobium sp. CF614]SFG34319.1 Uncharacterized iron-regulated membrane protein [Novosphingobium sp. CF614]
MATVAATGMPKKGQVRRSLWWRVHQWAGLQLSLFLAFVLATGTIATLSHEIDWLLTPAMRVAPQETAPVSWGKLAASARDAAGDARIEWIYAPSEPWFAVEAVAEQPSGDRFRIQIDPWTAEVRGRTPWFNAQRLFRELHRNLMMPTAIGVPIVTALAFPLLASVVTAFWVYKKWWRGFFRAPRRRKGRRNDGRRFTGDLHRFVGLWSLWFVALIGVTGIWYFVEKMGGAAPVPRPPEMLAPAQTSGTQLDVLVTKARQDFPDLHISSIGFPKGKPGGIVVMGQAKALLVRERANAVMLDPDSQAVVEVVRGEELSLHQRISEAADPLHFGTWGGLPARIVWFLHGAALTGLAVTGVLIYALRLRQDVAARQGGGVLAAMWRGMGFMAWPSLALVILAFALIPTKLTGE